MPSNEQRRQAAKRKLESQLVRRAEQAKRRRTITIAATVAVVIAAVVGVFYFTNSSGESSAAKPKNPAPPKVDIPTEPAPPPVRPAALPDPVSCEYRPQGEPSKPVPPPANGDVASQGTAEAIIDTNVGEIPLKLDRALAPCTVNSFIHLAEQKFYDGTSCHRIGTEGLQMLQCGDPTGKGSGGPGYAFDDETFPELKYGRGYLAMANSGKNTNGSQFFMVFGKAQLPPNYTVFGTISESGLQVIDKIARAGHDGAFDSSAGGGHPNQEVTFNKVTVKEA